MKSEMLEMRLKHLEPLVIRSSSGSVRVLEKSARIVCDIDADAIDEGIIDQLQSLLTASVTAVKEPSHRIVVELVGAALALDEIGASVSTLCDLLGPVGVGSVKVHLDSPPEEWSPLLSRLKMLRESLKRPRDTEIELIGPFVRADEADMERIFELGIRLRFSAGWVRGVGSNGFVHVDELALRAYSEFGFRAAVVWYIHADNLSACEDAISSSLIANYSSGFSLPLVSANPFYRFAPGFPELPAASDYCRLLVRSYKKYPYYDDLLSPLNGIALLVKEGGWHSGRNIPKAITLSVNANGDIGMYRQAPALSAPWCTIAEVASLSHDQLRDSFLDFVARASNWDHNLYCRNCRWRYICGGLDAISQHDLRRSDLDTMCGHRMLFLEHFASLRVPDSVLRKS